MKHNQPPEDEGEREPWFFRQLDRLRRLFDYTQMEGDYQVPLTEGDLVARYPSAPDTPELIEKISKKEQPIAVAALNMWQRSVYRPEVVLWRESSRLLAADHARRDVAAFEAFYMDEANARLHKWMGPVAVAEALFPVPSTDIAYCRHCSHAFYGQVAATVTVAEYATDIEFSLAHYRGMTPGNLIVFREPRRGKVIQFPFTQVDSHMLKEHAGTRAATAAATTVFRMMDISPVAISSITSLEDPRYPHPRPNAG